MFWASAGLAIGAATKQTVLTANIAGDRRATR
jgi:hypothetical protein